MDPFTINALITLGASALEAGLNYFANKKVQKLPKEDFVAPNASAFRDMTDEDRIVRVSSVELNKTHLKLPVGSIEMLTASIFPSDATNKRIRWTSGNTDVAGISDGIITANGPGQTSITAISEDMGFAARCIVTVVIPVTNVSLDKAALILNVGDCRTLTATVEPENATDKTIVWKVNNTAVAYVSNGIITATTSGVTTVIAVTQDGGLSASCHIKVLSFWERLTKWFRPSLWQRNV